MTHRELKKRLKELGFEVFDSGYCIGIIYEGEEIAWVHKYNESVMDCSSASKLPLRLRTELLLVLVEYTVTSIEDREDEVRLSIYPIWTKNFRLVRYDDKYYKYGFKDERSFGIDDYEFYGEDGTRVFSEDEAREICDFFGWDFELVVGEVDEDELY